MEVYIAERPLHTTFPTNTKKNAVDASLYSAMRGEHDGKIGRGASPACKRLLAIVLLHDMP